jgi:hypothetical protein
VRARAEWSEFDGLSSLKSLRAEAVPKPGVFVKETMNALADLGEKMGADPSTWSTSPA